MRFPSLQVAGRAAGDVLRRYPFALAAAGVAAGAAWQLADGGDETALVRVLLSATLGLPLFIALATWASRQPDSAAARWIPPVAGALLLAGFWMLSRDWTDQVLGRRYVQINLALHCLVAVLAYARRDEPNGFWQFNRRLFERFLVSAVFSGVLYLGLTLALLAVDNLFGVDIDEKNYLRLWFVIAFVFNTWYFLGGVPRRLSELESATDYPQGLKIFAQYILVPLVLVYLVILMAYLGRVAFTREWPSGWIGYLVSGVAVLGILAQLLVHPVRGRTENRWIGSFARGFWFALVPALAMQFTAIVQRINQYGITENRYFLFVFACWLSGLSLFFILQRSGSIAVIPWSLAAIAFGTAFGPWGAYAVSEASQTERLGARLESLGLLVDGRLRAREEAPGPGAAASFEDRREVAAGVRYLLEHPGPQSLEGWFAGLSAPVDSVLAAIRDPGPGRRHTDDAARVLLGALGLEYVDRWANPEQEHLAVHVQDPPTVLDVREWDYIVNLQSFNPGPAAPRGVPADPASPPADRFRVETGEGGTALEVWDTETRLFSFPLAPAFERMRESIRRSGTGGGVPAEDLRFELRENGVHAVLQITWISVERKGDRDELTGLNGSLFLKFP